MLALLNLWCTVWCSQIIVVSCLSRWEDCECWWAAKPTHPAWHTKPLEHISSISCIAASAWMRLWPCEWEDLPGNIKGFLRMCDMCLCIYADTGPSGPTHCEHLRWCPFRLFPYDPLLTGLTFSVGGDVGPQFSRWDGNTRGDMAKTKRPSRTTLEQYQKSVVDWLLIGSYTTWTNPFWKELVFSNNCKRVL